MRRESVCLLLVAAVFCIFAPAAQGRDLTFEERVTAQEAIERVFWNHRLWPKENPGPKPALSTVMPREAVRAKVEDYLRKSSALETWWQRPITAVQLQAELDRMSANTHDGGMLRELYTALGNSALVVAETLARQTLADRLLRNWYAFDPRFHAEVRRRAEEAVGRTTSPTEMRTMGGEYSESTFVLQDGGAPEAASPAGAVRVQALSSDEWDREIEVIASVFGVSNDAAPTGTLSPLQETPDAFYVGAVLDRTETSVTVATVTWRKTSFDAWWNEVRSTLGSTPLPASGPYGLRSPHSAPCANDSWRPTAFLLAGRSYHTAVWTGTEMIVWGGQVERNSENTGGRYNPATDSWLPTSMDANVPDPRQGHSAVWTGTEMIVWGGYRNGTRLNTGGRYDPIADHWAPVSIGSNVPAARDQHAAVWTGSEMIVWGGTGADYAQLKSGGRYDPLTNNWRPTSTGANVPSWRSGHTAVWTGSEMIVWGGYDGGITNLDTGGRYNPSTDAWAATSTGANVPEGREQHTAVWTGTEMIVWGGRRDVYFFLNTGARYDPVADRWVATSTGEDSVLARAFHSAVWTGSEMIVWGGRGSSGFAPLNSGSRYDPRNDSWTALSATATTPRAGHTAVWTGSEMIVWGGGYYSNFLNSGARYDPSDGSWVPTAPFAVVPEARRYHTAVWTGTEMIVWGGVNYIYYGRPYRFYVTGGRYVPSLDAWVPTSTGANVPSSREVHAAVWTGTEMIVWGGAAYRGNYSWSYLDTGGRYSPLLDTWSPTSTGANAPTARAGHSLVWTGSEMIVWGGVGPDASGYPSYLVTGARYDPGTDTWLPTSTGTGNPTPRSYQTAVWTGAEMIVWGGQGPGPTGYYVELDSGGRYDPSADRWIDMPVAAGTPSARLRHTAVWTGREMIVWGGEQTVGGSNVYLNSGGRYDPATNRWTPVSTAAGVPEPRAAHTSVWTGSEMIVWGGVSPAPFGFWKLSDTGGRYRPASDQWLPTSTGASLPQPRWGHTAVWTGTEMIVWGGTGVDQNSNDRDLDTGGRYCALSNQPPVADAGDDQTLECAGELQATATLDGSGSTDPDSTPGTHDDIESFDWTEGDAPLASGMIVSMPLHLGAHDVTLTVTDKAGATASDGTTVTVVDTTPPSIACPAAVTIECRSAGQALVALAPATASDLCYGSATTANDRTAGGADASGSYPLGTTIVTFTATDGSGNHASCRTAVTVRDTIPPVVTAVASPGVLWPPNHKMSTVNATVVATDACDPSPSIVLVSVTSSEPDDAAGGGDGQTTDDIQGAALGTPDLQVLLRAERDGNGRGRTYTIAYQTFDHSGNSAVASAQVAVPHDMSQGEEPLNFVMENSRGTTLIWGPVEGARHYDVIRGDLANLRIDGSSIDLGQVVCIARDTAATTTIGAEDAAIPEPGHVFFYAVQYDDGREDSSYGSESAGRARVVRPNSGDCS